MARKKRIHCRELITDPTPQTSLTLPNEIPQEFQQILSHFCTDNTQETQDPGSSSSESDLPSEEAADLAILSKKKLKKASRMTIPQLKAIAPCPEVVEFEDVTAPDPVFLVNLKSCPNTIPVPGHWSQKRKYLAGKRGFLKAPYELPAYIKETGIVEQRSALRAREESMSMGAKARDKMNPRLGKLDLDYEKMYNAFFKWQTKPEMSPFGDIYYEGKEFEVRLRDKKPGFLSDELKEALGMTVLAPPPYLYNMQRFGPPPSYSYLRIPGVSAPIPPGCQWGFHPGGWGKPPLDAQGQPLYGDVYGVGTLLDQQGSTLLEAEEIDRQRWGILIPEEEPVLPPPPPPVEEEPELGPVVVEAPKEIVEEPEEIGEEKAFPVKKPIQRPVKQPQIKRDGESVTRELLHSEEKFKF